MKRNAEARWNVWRAILRLTFLFVSLRGTFCQNDFLNEAAHLWPSDSSDAQLQSSMNGDASSPRLTSLDVICGKEFMTVRAEFNAPFNGIVSSKGTYDQSKCVYVKPHSDLTHVTFNVRYDECGTKPDLQGKYYENTIVIQYGTDIIEAFDEAKRLRCEWFEAYEKPATFRPAIPVADLDIIEMNFQGDEIDCWMSIQEGKGPWSSEINRIVTVGQPLSIVVAINDHKNQFDMKVKSCFAHDGIKPPIYLIDEDGCVLRSKMISPFKKIRNPKGKASLVSYAQFLAFKFPDSVDVQIQCTVEVCRHGCSNTCESGDRSSDEPKSHQKPSNVVQDVNRFLLENSDLLESASANEPISVTVPANAHSVDIGSHAQMSLIEKPRFEQNQVPRENATKQTQLNNIAAFVHDVEQNAPTGSPEKTAPSSIEMNIHNQVPHMHSQMKPTGPIRMNRPMMPMPFHSVPFPRSPPRMRDPVAQVLNIPLSPMYIPGRPPPTTPNLMNPFGNLNIFNSMKSPFLPQLLSNYLGKNRRSQYAPNDNFQIINQHSPTGQRLHRSRRYIHDKQGEVGLKRGFQVVTSLDLSFAPNMSGDQMPDVYEGIPAPIVYGLCFSTSHVYFALGLTLLLLLVVISCVYILYRLESSKKERF